MTADVAARATRLCGIQKKLQGFSIFVQDEGNFSVLLMLKNEGMHFGLELRHGKFQKDAKQLTKEAALRAARQKNKE